MRRQIVAAEKIINNLREQRDVILPWHRTKGMVLETPWGASPSGKLKFLLPVRLGLLLTAILVGVSPTTRADTSWVLPAGQSDDWSVAKNWTSGVPTSSISAEIDNGGTARITQSGEVCNGLFLGNYGDQSGTIQMTGGSLASYYSTIGNFNTGVFNQSAGNNTINDDLDVGFGGQGTYTLSGTAQLSVGMHEYMGRDGGVGLLQQSGGTNTTPYLFIGAGNRYLLTGGTLQINGGLQTKGTMDCGSGNATINVAANSLVNFSKGTILNATGTSLTVGANSLLIVAQGFNPAHVFHTYTNHGTTHVLGTTLNVAAGTSIQGCADIDDFVTCQGSITAPQNQSINLNGGLDLSGTGSVDLGNGDLTTDGQASKMDGGTVRASRHFVSGSFVQSAGTNSEGFLLVGGKANTTGTYHLDGTGNVSASNAYVGCNGNGMVVQTAGTFSVFGDLYVGLSGSGSVEQSGGTTTIGSGGMGLHLDSDSSYSAAYSLTGGTLILNNISGSGPQAAFNFGGGTFQAGAAFSTSLPMTLTGTGGNANVNTAGCAVTFSGQLSGPGGLNKLGSNTLTLSSDNTYGGPTAIYAGTLNVANTTGSATGSGALTVNSGATLTGSGSIAGPVTLAGTLSPGNGPGILTVNNQVTFQAGSTFNLEVNGSTPGNGYDQLVTTGPVSLAGSLAFTFGTFTPTGHDILFLINNTGAGTTTGTFQYADNSKIGTFDGCDWYITYDANNAASPSLNGGNDVAVYSVAIPEPSTLVLLGFGALSLLAYGWRRRAMDGVA